MSIKFFSVQYQSAMINVASTIHRHIQDRHTAGSMLPVVHAQAHSGTHAAIAGGIVLFACKIVRRRVSIKFILSDCKLQSIPDPNSSQLSLVVERVGPWQEPWLLALSLGAKQCHSCEIPATET